MGFVKTVKAGTAMRASSLTRSNLLRHIRAAAIRLSKSKITESKILWVKLPDPVSMSSQIGPNDLQTNSISIRCS